MLLPSRIVTSSREVEASRSRTAATAVPPSLSMSRKRSRISAVSLDEKNAEATRHATIRTT